MVILISSRDAAYGCPVAAGLIAGYLTKDNRPPAGIAEVTGPAS